jgi:hypothetical protein
MKCKLIVIGILGVGLGVKAQTNENSIRIDQAIQDLTNDVAGNTNGSSRAVGSFVNFHTGKEDTKGSRYLFPNWVGGVVTTKNGIVIAKDSLLYNYDKISHDLYLTDQKTVVQVDGENIKAFTLTNAGQPMIFVRLETVQPNVFFQQLVEPGASGSGYGLYKLIRTTLKKADYHTDGLVETGSNYDEFVDVSEYYIVTPAGKEAKKVELKKKAIRESMADAKQKTDDYFAAHRSEDINELFLIGLVGSLNH